jgi:hypothetical protein
MSSGYHTLIFINQSSPKGYSNGQAIVIISFKSATWKINRLKVFFQKKEGYDASNGAA